MQQYLPMPEVLRLSDLPSLLLTERAHLPKEPGIYFVLDGSAVRYIGRTYSLYLRWRQHHRLEEFLTNPTCSIAWLTVSNIGLLPAIEEACIRYFAPPDNKAPGCKTFHGRESPAPQCTMTQITYEGRELLRALAYRRHKPMYEVLEDMLKEALAREEKDHAAGLAATRND